MGAQEHPAYQEELIRLRCTRKEVQRQLARLQAASTLTIEGEDLDDASMHGIRATEEALEGQRQLELRRLRLAAQEPYFGRVDFQEAGEDLPESFYIGKVAVEDSASGLPLVIDWRAPLASIFYAGAGEADLAAYEAPAGTIAGTLWLKRNLMVRRGMLRHIADSHVKGEGGVLGDTHLLYALQESRDGRLREVVATIQAEQNRIIRADPDRLLIVQGRAGSGKTSVALHRVAYLLYAHRHAVSAERILIFAPNRIFLDYIADVLPELGVSGVRQVTFAEWALAQLGRKVHLVEPGDRLEHLFAPGSDAAAESVLAGQYKGSLHFEAVLSQALSRFEAELVPGLDLELWPGARVTCSEVQGWFHDLYRAYPLNMRRKRVLARLKRWAINLVEGTLGRDDERQRRRAALGALRRYASLWPRHTAVSLYRHLLESTPELPRSVAAPSLETLREGRVLPEDLAALLYLHERLNGLKDQREWDHVVIDEAQDFSPFQVALLRRLTRGDSLTILGDLAQGIHTHMGIRSWASLLALFEPGSVSYHELQLSYRSTHEIVCFANHVLAYAGAGPQPGQPVFRQGPPVRLGPLHRHDARRVLTREVQRLQGRHTSIAVVGRTQAECDALYQLLVGAGFRPQRVTAYHERFRGGLSVIPSYLTKGLEFDAVLVADAGATAYGETVRDARLLYVVLTRALHELVVYYQGELSPLLRELAPDLYERVE